MQVKPSVLRYTVPLVFLLGCSKASQPAVPPASTAAPAAKTQVRVTGVNKISFPNGKTALVLNYETNIAMSEKQALREEVDAIWKDFQKDVEKAGVNNGVIRATHNETTGFITTGKGRGFVFSKDGKGNWRLDDAGK